MPTISRIMQYYRDEEIQAQVKAFGILHKGHDPFQYLAEMIPDFLQITATMAKVMKRDLLQGELEGLDLDPLSSASPYFTLAIPGMRKELALPWIMSGLGDDLPDSPEGLQRILLAQAGGNELIHTLTQVWETGTIFCELQVQAFNKLKDPVAEQLSTLLTDSLDAMEAVEMQAAMYEAQGATKQ